MSTQWGLESDFSMVRLIFLSPAVAGYTVQSVSVGVSAAIGNSLDPVNAAGAVDLTLFQRVYFNNNGANTGPQDQIVWGSGTTTLTIPAGSVTQPGVYFSDWVRIPSLARTDGGIRRLLMTRQYTNANPIQVANVTSSAANLQAYNAVSGGRIISSFLAFGTDYATTPAAIGSASATTYMNPWGVQYMAGNSGYSVLGVGDSLTLGLGGTSQMFGWGVSACQALSTPALPISYYNQGFAGQVSGDFWANGYTAFKACKPDVVTIPVWTPNDSMTQAACDTSFSRAVDFVDYAAKNGAVPVLMGPMPGSAAAGAQETARLSTRTRMLQLASNGGFYCLDLEALIGTGESPNKIPPAYNSTTFPNHPNDVGNAIIDNALFRPMLRKILSV